MAFIAILGGMVSVLVLYVLAEEGHFEKAAENWRKKRDYRAFDRADKRRLRQAAKAQRQKDETYRRLPGVRMKDRN